MWRPQFAALRADYVAGVILDWRPLIEHAGFLAREVPYPVFTGSTREDGELLVRLLRSLGIHKIPSNHTEGLGDSFARFSNGGNSGFAAIQLAVLFGMTAIGLLGFDGAPGGGERLHFHDEYRGEPRDRSRYGDWCRHLEELAPLFECLGIEVVNLSPRSELGVYPRVALQRWNAEYAGRVKAPPGEAELRANVERVGGGELALPYEPGEPPGESGCYGPSNPCYGGAVNAADPGRYRPVPARLEPWIAGGGGLWRGVELVRPRVLWGRTEGLWSWEDVPAGARARVAQLLAELVGEERRAVLLEFSKREQGIPELGGVAWVRVAPGRSSAPAAPPRVLVCASLQSVTRRTAGDAVGVLRRCGPEAALVLLRDSAEDDAGFWLERLAESWSGWERLELGGFVAVCRRTGPRRSRAGE